MASISGSFSNGTDGVAPEEQQSISGNERNLTDARVQHIEQRVAEINRVQAARFERAVRGKRKVGGSGGDGSVGPSKQRKDRGPNWTHDEILNRHHLHHNGN